ncbi:MAG: DUF484 family protein [Pseudomonadota bacterium]
MNAEEVAHYLQNHPNFFEEQAEVMAKIVLSHPHSGRAISITERQLLMLREKNKKLESKLHELVQFGEENDVISEKMHRLGVAMIAAPSFQAILHTLNFHLRDDFAVPHVALRLWQRPADLDELPEFADVGEELQVFAETLNQPYVGSTADFQTTFWFGAAAGKLRSQALIAMRNGGGTIGLIALGSEDTQRFFAGMGTLYLERLGEMASAALVRVLR